MLTFRPTGLEADFRAALSRVEDVASLRLEDARIETGFKAEDFQDIEVTGKTELSLEIHHCDPLALSLEDVIALANEVSAKSTSFDGLIYHSTFRTLLRIRPQDARSAAFLETVGANDEPLMSSTVAVGEGTCNVGLATVSPHVALWIVAKDYFYDKYFPPMSSDDCFIEVRHKNDCDIELDMAVAQAYLFELNSSLGLMLAESPRPTGGEELYPEEEQLQDLFDRARRLRPLLMGTGMSELLREFNKGVASWDVETTFLCLVKCIEYVSATVVRERQYEDLRKRLQSAEALRPTAAYLDGLLALFEENRQFTKDHEALRLTVERCCDPVLLAKHTPPCLANLASIASASKPAERRQALQDLAGCLSATRNQLAHAKANYELTGKECPSDQLSMLVVCAKFAAEQCIRWYAAQSPELRRG